MTGAGSSGSSVEEEGEEEEALEVDKGITEYERLRLETIKENEAVLARLNLKSLSTSLENYAVATPSVRKKKNTSLGILGGNSGERRRSLRLSSVKTTKVVDWSSDSSEEEAASDSDGPKSAGKAQKQAKKKKKQKRISLAKLDDLEEKKKDDVEYEPSENSDSEDFDEEVESESEPEGEVTRKRPPSRKPTTPVKRPRSRTLKSPVKRTISLNSPELLQKSPPPLPLSVDLDLDGDDDLDLQQALALSMASSADMASPGSSRGTRGRPSPQTPQGQVGSNSARSKRRKTLIYEESEIDAFFVSIVGNKDGRLSRRHLEKAASKHDFIWKDEEINDMIDMFDADGDGQLNLAEFRSMAKRSNLMEAR